MEIFSTCHRPTGKIPPYYWDQINLCYILALIKLFRASWRSVHKWPVTSDPLSSKQEHNEWLTIGNVSLLKALKWFSRTSKVPSTTFSLETSFGGSGSKVLKAIHGVISRSVNPGNELSILKHSFIGIFCYIFLFTRVYHGDVCCMLGVVSRFCLPCIRHH